MTPSRKKNIPAIALPSVTLIGCGNWGTALAIALGDAGVPLREIVVRRKRAADARLAASLGVGLRRWSEAVFDADVFWMATPDASIAGVAAELADRLADGARRKPIVFHSSGALASTELSALRAVGASVASVHPLMTFPRRAGTQAQRKHPLTGVPFAIEGEPRAAHAATKLVRALGGEPFALAAEKKPFYHAFGAFASPMLVAALTAAVDTGVAAGYSPQQARRRMRPMVERTIANFFADGPQKSFSGPIARGDTATVARHLQALQCHPQLRAVYVELARFALESLPARKKKQIEQLLIAPKMNPENKSASRRPRSASTA